MLRLILFGIGLLVLSSYGQDENTGQVPIDNYVQEEPPHRKEDLRKVHLEGLGNVLGMKFWDGEFYEFFGIPYATVPRDRDRYKPPLPPKPWDEDFKANKGVMLCQQVYLSHREDEGDLLFGEEECLGVSFMVPKIATETNLVPVIVFIHSGAYVGGNGNMAKFHYLARQDVIVANMNYRLGAYGFACLGTEDVPGNAGLKDIIAALKFIKKHVKSFGGDPDNITLAGYGIGATLAEIIALSPESNGLFDKLALDSGSALNPYAVNRDPLETARNIAISVGYDDTNSVEDLNEFYLDADPEDILGVSRNFFLKNSTFGFAPCIENPNNPGAVLTESPLETLKKGKYGDFALLLGFSNMEGISRTSQFDEWRPEMNENFADFLPADLVFDNEKEKDEFIKEVKQFYFDNKPLTVDSVQNYIDYFTDAMFKYAFLKSLKFHSQNLKRSIYAYEFTYVGKLNTQHNYMDRIRGSSHRDASAYVLDFYDWTRNYTDMDRRDLMSFMWADFLKFENPTAYESTLNTVKWLKYTDKGKEYMDIGDKLAMKKDPFPKGYQLWDKAYNKHYWNPTVVDPIAYQKILDAKPKPVKRRIPVETKPVENKPADETKTEEKQAETPSAAVPKVPVEAVKNSANTDVKPAVVDPKQEGVKAPNPKEASEKPSSKTENPAEKPKVQKPAEEKPKIQKPVEEKPKVQTPASSGSKTGSKEDVKK